MPIDPETIREEGVNVLLAEMLRDRGVSARAERRTRQGIPDIRVQLPAVVTWSSWNASGRTQPASWRTSSKTA